MTTAMSGGNCASGEAVEIARRGIREPLTLCVPFVGMSVALDSRQQARLPAIPGVAWLRAHPSSRENAGARTRRCNRALPRADPFVRMKFEKFVQPTSLAWAGASLFIAAGLLWGALGPGANEYVLQHVLLDEARADETGVTFELIGPRPPFRCMSKIGDGRALATYQLERGESKAPWPGGTYGDVHLTVTERGCLLTKVDRRRSDGTLVEEAQK